MRVDLREQFSRPRFRRCAEENSAKFESAAQGFFNDAEALNRTLTVGGKLAAPEGLAQLFKQCIVTALDAAKACGYRFIFARFFHAEASQQTAQIIRCIA
jgi:tRNA G26 N,N-dimethylase Trm1